MDLSPTLPLSRGRQTRRKAIQLANPSPYRPDFCCSFVLCSYFKFYQKLNNMPFPLIHEKIRKNIQSGSSWSSPFSICLLRERERSDKWVLFIDLIGTAAEAVRMATFKEKMGREGGERRTTFFTSCSIFPLSQFPGEKSPSAAEGFYFTIIFFEIHWAH